MFKLNKIRSFNNNLHTVTLWKGDVCIASGRDGNLFIAERYAERVAGGILGAFKIID